MAALKLFLLTVFISLVLAHVGARADASVSDVEEVKVAGSDGPDSAVLEQLKSKIHSLESQIEEKIRELKEKDHAVAAKEKIIKEKSDAVVSLKSEIASLHKKGKLDAAEKVGKAHARAGELEKEVEKLRKDLHLKTTEKDLLEARVTEAEKKFPELNSKLASLQKIIDDQKAKIRKTQRALEIAEEELMKAKFEATSRTKELMQAHGAWFPPWLAVHLNNYQALLEENWKVHGKPALESLVKKATEKKAQAEEWAAPHVETVKTKLVPAIKEQWVVIATNIEPHVQTLTTKAVEIYEVSKEAVTPHIVKVQELANPYFQELRKVSKPYIDNVATAARPHVDKLQTTLKPYTQEAVKAYTKFLESATLYHGQVQNIVHDKLKSYEVTKPLATKELVWFSASALLALPIILLLKIFSAFFGKKGKKPTRHGNAHNARRKGKRVHSDK
ncbi:uncharacterized protein LOC131014998 [Salvia miltiorrhiza]|uniref:uncharacterized protein LOC131014998 n=1 Tax=Salvia miltiorrhiza TaxID=226208 RepID=UPI0025AD8448|nr:uncharacterized protein LOC131014998 [Salvia miltiorrhiza]XP_057799165.1 uncharacterized protein LOC131014998 [Salvia miltiorrhiza]